MFKLQMYILICKVIPRLLSETLFKVDFSEVVRRNVNDSITGLNDLKVTCIGV